MRNLEYGVLIAVSAATIVGCTQMESPQQLGSAQDPEEIVLCGTGNAGPADLVREVVQRCRAGEWVRIEISGFLFGSEMLSICDLTVPVLPAVMSGISDKTAVLCRYRGEPRHVWLVQNQDSNQLTLLQPFGTNRSKLR